MEHISTAVISNLAAAWGFLWGLYVSYKILKDVRRRHAANLRRARRVYIDVDAQCINDTQLVCRVTINQHKALLIFVSADTPLHYQVSKGDADQSVDVDTVTPSSTLQ